MKTLQLLGLCACLPLTALGFDTRGANDVTAVCGQTSNDYIRTRLADSSYASESYVFGKGGVWGGAMQDASIDRPTFLDVAHAIAHPLADQNFLPSRDPGNTKLLIMVYWGTTHVPVRPEDSSVYKNLQQANENFVNIATEEYADEAGVRRDSPARDEIETAHAAVEIEDDLRKKQDALNAEMLGYDSWWDATQMYVGRGFGLDYRRKDMIDELEQERYFVVVMAYDFQLMYRQKKHKLLWETRFSIRQMHHEFDRDLPAMAQYASLYFGQDSNGLIHKSIPIGHVDIGESKSLGAVPEK